VVSFDELSPIQVRTVQAAIECASRAYAPYSGFPVGAALTTIDGDVFGGCNVESASYGLSICAERVAVGNAYTNRTARDPIGARLGPRRFECVAVYAPCVRRTFSGDDAFCYPCGACRQVLVEHAAPGAELVLIDLGANSEEAFSSRALETVDGRYLVASLATLLPFGFNGDQLPDKAMLPETTLR
jgi:cytidine deaminase